MTESNLPNIEKLAQFWDTHDLTDFEGELVEVTEPVFVRGAAIIESPPQAAAQDDLKNHND